MTADEKARKLCVPLFAEIHRDICGMLSMGDIACIIGQRMHDVCMAMHEWTLANAAVAGEREAEAVGTSERGQVTR